MTIKNSLHLLLALWLTFLFFGSIIPPPTPATRRNGKSIRNTNNEKPGIIRFHNDKQWTMACKQRKNPIHLSISLSHSLWCLRAATFTVWWPICVCFLLLSSLSTFFTVDLFDSLMIRPREARRVSAGLSCLSSACERLSSCLRWAERMNEKKKSLGNSSNVCRDQSKD